MIVFDSSTPGTDKGREHPWQQLKGETAARVALLKVLEVNDTAPYEEGCDFNPNFQFGNWLLVFLQERRRCHKQGVAFTRERGEERIRAKFDPTPEVLSQRREEAKERRRRFDLFILENRRKHNCYARDGLYRLREHESGTVAALFVDGSTALFLPGKGWFMGALSVVMPYGDRGLTMADRWFEAKKAELNTERD